MIELQPDVLYDVVTIRHITAYRTLDSTVAVDAKSVAPGARGKLRVVDIRDPAERRQNWSYKLFLADGWYAYLGPAGPMFQLVPPLQLLAETAE